MEGLTIAILLVTLVFGVLVSWLHRQGMAARERVCGEFPLAPDRAMRITLEAGLTTRERLLGKAVPVHCTGKGMKVAFACRAGVMSFEISGLGHAAGSRVLAHAEDLAVIRLPEVGGLGASATNVVYLKGSLARNPARLLRRRERVFRALERAARRQDDLADDGRVGRRVDVGGRSQMR
ncbi:hypothetical protein Ssi03_18230 [Sphaerisporangium siamense]|uniref:Uncharacterized protein n=1 Tax=Sphaerisporangium siamense TaxID=795645 RepID=A0A7W7DDW5_9ACTN|nr:hypothetical protein [Sphaerisporangium siamense]MBB4705027.1 hypothetical protein [Sphaerisporangium siamense]GII83833.1 hypothetical protein Ssi03_18230 [Sphaerisporangium siamense]